MKWCSAAVLPLAVACAAPAQRPGVALAPPATSSQGSEAPQVVDPCPMHMPGVAVSATDTAGGVAIVFRTIGDRAELQRRVERMAELHDEPSSRPPIGFRALAVRTRDGARLELTPNQPTELGRLRAHARWHARRLAQGECPLLARERGGSRVVRTPSSRNDTATNQAK